MKKLIIGIGSVCLIGLVGCASVRDEVPATQISGTYMNQPYSFIGPKNVNITNLDISVSTNGTLHVKVGSITAAMDPGVISMTTQGYAAMRAADSALIDNTINTATSAIGTISGKAAKSVVVP